MKYLSRKLALGLGVAAVLLSACASKPENGISACATPRPQVCTMEYKPVCGMNSRHIGKTYGNACIACGKPEVSMVSEGQCLTESK